MARSYEVWENARIATMTPSVPDYGVIEDGAIAVSDGRIAWVGPRRELPAVKDALVHDAGGGWITPGLIDCHTHLVFAGDPSAEFKLRPKGASYQEIARAGGGIRATVATTRAAREDELYSASLKRLHMLMAEGVTTVEMKSGYGLNVDSERKMLRVGRPIAAHLPLTVRTTFLGAHALPPEYDGRQRDYVGLVAV